jgi:chromate reductase
LFYENLTAYTYPHSTFSYSGDSGLAAGYNIDHPYAVMLWPNYRCSKSMRILGVTGSLRSASVHTGILRAARAHFEAAGHTFDLFVPSLPLFNSDIEESPGDAVEDWRERVAKADAIFIATCEYNYSISAALKNSLDWASRGPKGNVFAGKPAYFISAGGVMGGAKSVQHLRDISVALDMRVMNKPQIHLRMFEAPQQFDMVTGDLVNLETDKRISEAVHALVAWTNALSVKA